MKKVKLINEILDLNPSGAYHCRGEFIGNENFFSIYGDWTYPFRRYVVISEKRVEYIGGVSGEMVVDVRYKWNKLLLLKASVKELIELKKATKSTYDMYSKLFNKYEKPMNMADFLDTIDRV